MTIEYRVTWQREGQARKRALYQTADGAKRCAERQRSAAEEMDWLASPLPPIVYGPVIEEREVGEWKNPRLLAGFNTEVSLVAVAKL